MATQVSYPGVYIEEFTPAAPIEGVSTSVTAFIGLAERGPIGEPTLITSIDRYREVFGGPVLADIPYYLPLAVDGFFANGGRIAFVTRVSDAVAAHADLAAGDGTMIAVARAFADGAAGLGGRVTVAHTSALATALTAAGVAPAVLSAHRAQLTVTAVDATRRVLTVADSTGLQEGDLVVVSRGNSKAPPTTVAGVTPTSVTLVAAAPDAPAAGEWNRVTTADAAAGTRRIRVDVPDGVSLRATVPAGSVVSVVDGATTEWHVASEVGTDSLTLARPVAATFAAATTRLTTAEFSLTVTDPAGKVRTFAGLSTSPLHPRWWGSVIDDPYLRVVLDDTALPAGDPRPIAADTALAGAVNENAAASWNAILTGMPQLLEKLAPIDEISLVVAPGVTEAVPQQAIITHCERLFDRFALLDGIRTRELDDVLVQRDGLTGTLDKGFAALYYPWITVFDPQRRQLVAHPPSGHVAGIFAATDATRGVHKAPANVGIAGAAGLEWKLTDTDQGFINLKGVNALRTLPGRGQPVVFGARTTANDRNWQYINIRRLFLFLEESIQESLMGSVFEPNDLALWQKLKRTITDFLTRVWRDGALFGATAKEAFYVRIDEVLNPPSTRKLGRLHIEIGVQPVYPAEFIVVRIGIWDGGAEVAET